MSDIRVFMVDDHRLFRESLSRLLQTVDGIRVVGECTTAPDAVIAFSRISADVVLLDYDLGEVCGFGLIDELKKCQENAKVLMVTGGMSNTATLQVMQAGASGIFLKHCGLEQLIHAIHQVASGEIWMDTKAVSALVAGKSVNSEIPERSRPLTERQIEVMRGILDGLSNKEIGLKINCSESSVKAVIQELFQKTGVRTRGQLVRIAIEKHSSDWLRLQTKK